MAAAAAAAALPAFSGTPTVDAFSAAPEQAADKCLITIDSACSSYANRRHLISMDYSDETLAAIHAGLDELQASPNVHALARVQWKLEDGTLKLLVVIRLIKGASPQSVVEGVSKACGYPRGHYHFQHRGTSMPRFRRMMQAKYLYYDPEELFHSSTYQRPPTTAQATRLNNEVYWYERGTKRAADDDAEGAAAKRLTIETDDEDSDDCNSSTASSDVPLARYVERSMSAEESIANRKKELIAEFYAKQKASPDALPGNVHTEEPGETEGADTEGVNTEGVHTEEPDASEDAHTPASAAETEPPVAANTVSSSSPVEVLSPEAAPAATTAPSAPRKPRRLVDIEADIEKLSGTTTAAASNLDSLLKSNRDALKALKEFAARAEEKAEEQKRVHEACLCDMQKAIDEVIEARQQEIAAVNESYDAIVRKGQTEIAACQVAMAGIDEAAKKMTANVTHLVAKVETAVAKTEAMKTDWQHKGKALREEAKEALLVLQKKVQELIESA